MDLVSLNQELETILSSLEFEENGGIGITRFERYEDHWTIRIDVKTGVADEKQLWKCQVEKGLDFMLQPGYSENIEMFNDHPLLWSHNQKQSSLYFGKSTDAPYEVLSSLYSAHAKLTKGWIQLK